MPSFPPISVRQPGAFDLVDDPVEVCGVGTGFEGTFAARVRDALGTELAQVAITAGGTGIWSNFHVSIPLGSVPVTPQGALEVFEISAKDGSPINLVSVPIVFGRTLLDPYHGFAQHTVAAGDTLSGLADQFYGDSNLWPRVYEANRDQVANPNIIFVGQVLRIPQ